MVLLTIGAAAESLGMDRLLKSNTSKTGTHSLFRQGCFVSRLIVGTHCWSWRPNAEYRVSFIGVAQVSRHQAHRQQDHRRVHLIRGAPAVSRAQSQMFKDQASDRTAAAKASICLRLAMQRLNLVSGQQNLDDGIRSRRELGTPAMGLNNLSDDRQAQAAAI
jgi:hypothetical protein